MSTKPQDVSNPRLRALLAYIRRDGICEPSRADYKFFGKYSTNELIEIAKDALRQFEQREKELANS